MTGLLPEEVAFFNDLADTLVTSYVMKLYPNRETVIVREKKRCFIEVPTGESKCRIEVCYGTIDCYVPWHEKGKSEKEAGLLLFEANTVISLNQEARFSVQTVNLELASHKRFAPLLHVLDGILKGAYRYAVMASVFAQKVILDEIAQEWLHQPLA